MPMDGSGPGCHLGYMDHPRPPFRTRCTVRAPPGRWSWEISRRPRPTWRACARVTGSGSSAGSCRHRSLGLPAPRVEGRGATMDGSAGYARLAMRVAIRVARLSTALLASELARRRSQPASTSACRRSAFEGAFRQLRMEAGSSLADHAVAIAVPHIPIGGVRAVDRRGPVPARLPARDPSVPVRCFGGSLRRGESLRPRLCRARRPRSIPPAARARDQPIRPAAGRGVRVPCHSGGSRIHGQQGGSPP